MDRLSHEPLQRIMSFVTIADVRVSFLSKLDHEDYEEVVQELMMTMIMSTFQQMDIVIATFEIF